MLRPDNVSASGILGVIIVAIGSNFVINASIATSHNKHFPLVAAITGSMTMFSALYSTSLFKTTSIILLFETMPILTAS